MLLRFKRALRLRTRWRGFRAQGAAYGVWGAVRSRFYEHVSTPDGGEYQLHPRGVRYPLHVRCRTSDAFVMQQVFVEHGYGCLADVPDVQLVVDCGANVGYTSAYFLSCFPRCRVIAVEPDAANFAMLQRNLAPYGERVTLLRAGVWSHAVPLAVSNERYRDGREWSRQVALRAPDEQPDIDGVTIDALLAGSGCSRISILKIDIEGAETVVFSANVERWIGHVDVMAVELHDDSAFGNASEAFARAISGAAFAVTQHGELTVCRRLPGHQ